MRQEARQPQQVPLAHGMLKRLLVGCEYHGVRRQSCWGTNQKGEPRVGVVHSSSEDSQAWGDITAKKDRLLRRSPLRKRQKTRSLRTRHVQSRTNLLFP